MNFLNFYILGTLIMTVLVMINKKSLERTSLHYYNSEPTIGIVFSEELFLKLFFTITILLSWINVVITLYFFIRNIPLYINNIYLKYKIKKDLKEAKRVMKQYGETGELKTYIEETEKILEDLKNK